MNCRVYLGRLPYGTTEDDVRRFFRSYGRLRDINLKNNYGFVEFEDDRDADDAVYECNGKEMLGERILVEHSRGGARSSSSRPSRYSHNSDFAYCILHCKTHICSAARYGPPVRTPWRMTIENLSSRVSWQVGVLL
ncbi:predicted protein [Nematostella vectensis]|uniref:RRM domain-containing protein n=1 Tax=Nematostella vectensis TaxID=45351 RepID=A7S8T7_NEMVE|nr:predicted protein [Nematostella vectensis]|eukprot:XP_001631950.1 predicted protein [Nematostella vectensis]